MVKQVRDEFEKAEKLLSDYETKIGYCKQKIEEETEKQRKAKADKVNIILNFKHFNCFQPVTMQDVLSFKQGLPRPYYYV